MVNHVSNIKKIMKTENVNFKNIVSPKVIINFHKWLK